MFDHQPAIADEQPRVVLRAAVQVAGCSQTRGHARAGQRFEIIDGRESQVLLGGGFHDHASDQVLENVPRIPQSMVGTSAAGAPKKG